MARPKNDTRETKSIIAPTEYGSAFTSEVGIFCEPVASVDSRLFVEMLKTELRIVLGLAVIDCSSAKSCFVAISLSSITDIESARGLVA